MGRTRGLFLLTVVLALVAFVFAAGSATAVEQVAVTGVRAASHDGITRFVIDLSDDVSFTVDADAIPGRVQVDLPTVDWRTAAKGLSRPVGLLRNYSYAPIRSGAGRILLETTQAVRVKKSFIIPPDGTGKYRLVLDLESADAPQLAPVASAPVASVPVASVPVAPPPVAPPIAAAPAPVQATAAPTISDPPPPKPAMVSANPIITPAAAATPGGLSRHADGERVASGPLPAPAPAPLAPIPVAANLPVGQAPDILGKGGNRKPSHAGKPIVVIDPGHGGVDPGATSLSGAYEKNIVLALARDVKEQLDKGGKVNCVLTRDHDFFIPLRERVAIARNANADLFMSLHADTVADPEIRGLSVYTLSQTSSDAEAQALADKENKADIVAGIDLSNESPEVTNILIDLVQRESMNLSAKFAQQLIREVTRETRQLLPNTHRFAGFAVLKAPDVPSVLVETGYLSNEHDEQMLRQPEYRAKLATALARAIERYFAQTQRVRHS